MQIRQLAVRPDPVEIHTALRPRFPGQRVYKFPHVMHLDQRDVYKRQGLH